tara:strand:+ start:47 stop:613 length:567 start_codon:yes stop_codon:yes gene_type:complete
MDIKNIYIQSKKNYINALNCLEDSLDEISLLAEEIIKLKTNKKKVLIFGNGGSAAIAQHFASELVVRYKKFREPIRAISLNSDTSIITATANDFDYENIFERQIEAYCDHDDIVIGMSTSGKSKNILKAFESAQNYTKNIFAFYGNNKDQKNSEYLNIINVNSSITSNIQQLHLFIFHLICEYIDETL